MTIAVSFLAMFMSTFLSGFRSRSIALGQKFQASVTGALQTAGELVVVAMIVQSADDHVLIFWSCLSAGLGYYASMVMHDLVNRSYLESVRRRAKQEQKRLIDKRIDKVFKKATREVG